MIHKIDDLQPHACWDNTIPPRVVIDSGDTVEFQTLEGTGQIGPDWSSDDLMQLRSEPVHPLSGPVLVKDATPGDTLEIEVVSFAHRGWGWSAVFPGVGLLGSEFDRPYLHHYELTEAHCVFRDDILIPLRPFCGVMGVALPGPGRFNTYRPRENGGNVDIRDLTSGSRVLLPVLVDGALFSCGDCHAAQGDGEVNATGVEAPMTVTLRFNVVKDSAVKELQFYTSSKDPTYVDRDNACFVTTAHGPDLLENARTAIRYMIAYLMDRHNLSREQAYCLCGAAVNLHISEVVDDSIYIVSAYLPLALFE